MFNFDKIDLQRIVVSSVGAVALSAACIFGVAGPAHAGTFNPMALDRTFGPEVRFVGVPKGMKPNRPPSEGLQFFGVLRIDPDTRVLTVGLRNLAGQTLYSVDLPPETARRG